MRTPPPTHSARTAIACAAALLCACGGNDGDSLPAIPQLAAASGSTLAACTGLAGFTFARTTISSASAVAAGATVTADGATLTLPEYCYVQGKMNERVSTVDGQTYAIKWEMRLPKDWNGRFFFQPNGGNEGSIATPTVQAYGRILGGTPLSNGLIQGFAVITTDSGHDGAANTTVAPGIRSQVFGRDPAARTEHAHGYVASATPMAKALIKAAYGKEPDRSYMVGCSNGGRVAMVTATRYPDLFDGYVVGAPAFNLPRGVVAQIYNAQQMATISPLVGGKADISASFTQADMDAVANKVLERCDALDGASDGMVSDVAACKAAFTLANDVPTCSAANDGTCLSAAQKTALDRMMTGAKNAAGSALYSDWPYDPGLRAPDWRSWQMGTTSNASGAASATNPTSRIMTLTGPSMAFMFTNPPASTSVVTGLGSTLFDYVMGYSMETDAPKIFATGNGFAESPNAEFTPPDETNLDAMRNRGAKMLLFHGTGDGIWSYNDTQRWYEQLRARYGSGDTSAFSRLFTVPGMSHCSGGPATDRFDMVSALVNWVEQGQAPASVPATSRTAALNAGLGSIPAGRTRPLCAYPSVSRYNGSGSIDDAANFTCR